MFAALQVSSLETCLQRCKSIWGNFATKFNQVIYISSGYSTLIFGTAHLGFQTMLMEHTTVAFIGTQQEFSRSSPGALAAALARCCGAAKPTRWRPDFTVLPGKQTTMLKRLNNSCLLNKQTEKTCWWEFFLGIREWYFSLLFNKIWMLPNWCYCSSAHNIVLVYIPCMQLCKCLHFSFKLHHRSQLPVYWLQTNGLLCLSVRGVARNAAANQPTTTEVRLKWCVG